MSVCVCSLPLVEGRKQGNRRCSARGKPWLRRGFEWSAIAGQTCVNSMDFNHQRAAFPGQGLGGLGQRAVPIVFLELHGHGRGGKPFWVNHGRRRGGAGPVRHHLLGGRLKPLEGEEEAALGITPTNPTQHTLPTTTCVTCRETVSRTAPRPATTTWA